MLSFLLLCLLQNYFKAQPFWWLCWSSLTSNIIYSSLETAAKFTCLSRTQQLILSSKEHQAVVEIWPQISSDHALQAKCCQGLYHSLPWKKSQRLDQASCSLSVWLCQLSKKALAIPLYKCKLQSSAVVQTKVKAEQDYLKFCIFYPSSLLILFLYL